MVWHFKKSSWLMFLSSEPLDAMSDIVHGSYRLQLRKPGPSSSTWKTILLQKSAVNSALFPVEWATWPPKTLPLKILPLFSLRALSSVAASFADSFQEIKYTFPGFFSAHRSGSQLAANSKEQVACKAGRHQENAEAWILELSWRHTCHYVWFAFSVYKIIRM